MMCSTDPEIGRVVGGDHPEAQNVGAELLHHLLRGHDVAERFRHLPSLLVEHEAVGEHRLVGRAPPRAASLEQRGVEPAAMLVRSFEIERGGPDEVVPRLQREAVARAGIEPDVQDIGDLLVIGGIAVFAQKAFGRALEPGVRALFLDGLDDALQHRLVAQRLAGLLVDEHRDRHPPGALARDAPVGPRGNHAFEPVTPRLGVERGARDRVERLLPQSVLRHSDEPLRRVAEDQRLLRAP